MHLAYSLQKALFGKELIKSWELAFFFFCLHASRVKVLQHIISQAASSVCSGWGQSGQPVCLASQSAERLLTHGCSCCPCQCVGVNSYCSVSGCSCSVCGLPLRPQPQPQPAALIGKSCLKNQMGAELNAGITGAQVSPTHTHLHSTCRRPHCCHVNISPWGLWSPRLLRCTALLLLSRSVVRTEVCMARRGCP